MIRELVNRLCDWKQYETVKNRGNSVTSVQLSSTKSRVTGRESCTSNTSPDLTERTYLTLRISNQSSGVFLLFGSATRVQVCFTLRISNQSSGVFYSAYQQPEFRCVFTLRISNQSSGVFYSAYQQPEFRCVLLCVSATRVQVCFNSSHQQPEFRCVLTLRISNQSSGVF